MKKILIFDQDYPSENNLYGDVFVHTRAKEYVKYVEVLVVSFFKEGKDYDYEGIRVRYAPKENDIVNIFKQLSPDFIFIHFYHRGLYDFISNINTPVFVWVHGYEAIGWYRRLFNYTVWGFLRHSHNIVRQNIQQMLGFRKLVKLSNSTSKIHFVFVSNWMKQITETDSLSKIQNFSIIPNPINIDLFKYVQKEENDRKKILLIRSFHSSKYATDIAIDAILKLSKKSYFEELTFAIYGKGRLFQSQTEVLRQFKNVHLFENFIPNTEIPAIHKNYGIFLCPTRQDAQGVSMCEAMSSGLVPITSNNTAIPEFVKDKETGILTNSSKEIVDAINAIFNDSDLFLSLSKNASSFIQKECDIKEITSKELSLIKVVTLS